MLAHVPVCGVRTRSLGGALLLLLLPSSQAVWTRSLGGDAGKPRFNVAIERWNATHFLSVRNVQRPRYTRGAACRSMGFPDARSSLGIDHRVAHRIKLEQTT